MMTNGEESQAADSPQAKYSSDRSQGMRSGRPRPRRRFPNAPLWAATAISLTVFSIAGLVVLYFLGRPWLSGWWPPDVGELFWKDRLLVSGAVVTLTGAVVALVINYRKQNDAETNRFSLGFADAARQLGDASPAVRIAGGYAVAALADRHPDRRQQCIDVLCGYIRLPYSPNASAGHLTEKTVETIDENSGRRLIEKATYRADDREVRLTIIRIIQNHLRVGVPVSWHGHNFDFTGASFDGGDFSGSVFSGGLVYFSRARFSGRVCFTLANFSGAKVLFDGTKFSDGEVTFLGAQISAGEIDFTDADFSGGEVDFSFSISGGEVDFRNADFSGGTVSFDGAEFRGGKVDFSSATFSGGRVEFSRAKFLHGEVDFTHATFSDGNVNFDRSEFLGGEVYFMHAVFDGGAVQFEAAKFSGAHVSFLDATFSGGDVSFTRGLFDGGRINFMGARFSSGVRFSFASFSGTVANFNLAKFSGGGISFIQTRLSGGKVDFSGLEIDAGFIQFDLAVFDGAEVNISFDNVDLTAHVGFDSASLSGGTLTLDIPRSTAESMVTFEETVWGGTTVEICGKMVSSNEDAQRALAVL